MKAINRQIFALFTATVLLASVTARGAETENVAGKTVEGTVNINTATAQELSLLPGIGISKAQAIIKYRENQPFKKIEQIMKVKGIGRKSYANLKPYLATEGQTTLKRKVTNKK